MQLLLQDSAWSCLPTAFAMALHVLPKQIYEHCGHKGDDVLWPDLPEPNRRRSFHIDEMIDFCISQCCYPVCITPRPATLPPLANHAHFPYNDEVSEARLRHYLDAKDGVFVGYTREGKRHAVAWSVEEQLIFDPNGSKYDISEFEIEQIYLIF